MHGRSAWCRERAIPGALRPSSVSSCGPAGVAGCRPSAPGDRGRRSCPVPGGRASAVASGAKAQDQRSGIRRWHAGRPRIVGDPVGYACPVAFFGEEPAGAPGRRGHVRFPGLARLDRMASSERARIDFVETRTLTRGWDDGIMGLWLKRHPAACGFGASRGRACGAGVSDVRARRPLPCGVEGEVVMRVESTSWWVTSAVVVLLGGVLLAAPTTAFAQRRVALVIGNAAYVEP